MTNATKPKEYWIHDQEYWAYPEKDMALENKHEGDTLTHVIEYEPMKNLLLQEQLVSRKLRLQNEKFKAALNIINDIQWSEVTLDRERVLVNEVVKEALAPNQDKDDK